MKIVSVTKDGKNVEYNESVWTGAKKIIIDGELLNQVPGNKKAYYNNGEQYKIKGNIMVGSRLEGGQETIELVSKPSVLDWILSFIPLILVFIGGAIGGGCAGIALVINITVLKLYKNIGLKLALGLGIAACAAGAWLGISAVLVLLGII